MNVEDPQRRRKSPEPWLTPGRLASLVGVLLATYAALAVVRALRGVLLMLLVSLFLSFAMEPAVQYLGRRGWKRGPAATVVFVALAVLVVAALATVAPLLVSQIVALINNTPRSLDELTQLLNRLPLPFVPDLAASPDLAREVGQFSGQLRDFLLGAAGNVVDIGVSAFGVIFQLLTIALVTFYLVVDGPRLRRALARPLIPERQREMLAIWELAVAKTGGYVYSRVLLALVCATLHAIFLLLIGVPYPVPLAFWVGITSAFVPVVGTYLGGILLLVVAATNEPLDALWVLAFLVAYQQVENLLLAPRVQARTMDVHPAIAFVSVVVGGALLGAVGALLALPATAIIQALLSTYIRRHELIAELTEVRVFGDPPEPKRSRADRRAGGRVGPDSQEVGA